MPLGRVRALGVTLMVLLPSRAAFAQPANGDELTAAAQFDRGLSEMQAGRFETGCPALAESYRLDPQAGALFTLAECEAKWGKIASAVAHYDDFLRHLERMIGAQRQGQQQRETVARSQRDALRPQIPTLEIRLAKGTPATTVVKRDGVPMGAASLGVALPIDPGEHLLRAEGPDGSQREERIVVAIGEKRTVTLELPLAAPVAPPVVVQPLPVAPELPPARWGGWTYVAFGTAAVAAGVGGVTGVLVIDKKSTIEEQCRGVACNAEGKTAADAAQTLGAVSTVSFVLAGVGLAAGVVLMLTDPAKKRSATVIGPGVVRVAW